MNDDKIKEKNGTKRKHFVNISQAFTTMLIIGGGLLVFFALYRFESIANILKNIIVVQVDVILRKIKSKMQK